MPGKGVSLNFANLSVSAPEHVPIPTTTSSMSAVGMAITHSLVRFQGREGIFRAPVVMANSGVKSSTMVQEMVMTLFLLPSQVVTRTTGPGSMRVKTLLIFSSRMENLPEIASIHERPGSRFADICKMRNVMTRGKDGVTRPLGVVVTGGTAGLGLAMAKMFLLAGDRVVICGRDQNRLEAALGQLRTEAPEAEAHGMTCDVSAPGEAQAFVSYAVSKLGIIDRWINNAGTAGRLKRPLWELAPDDIDETCRTNLCGTMMLCAEVIRAMLRQPFEGAEPSFHIFNMGFSASGVRASPPGRLTAPQNGPSR